MPPAPDAEPGAVADAPSLRRRALGRWAGRMVAVAVAAAVLVGIVMGLGRDGGATALFQPDRPTSPPSAPPVEGQPTVLPTRLLPPLGPGPDVDLSAYAGRPTLVNFWATWCGPCVEEMPVLRDAHRQLAGQVAFLGINVQDNEASALDFLEELDVAYDQARDPLAEYFTAVGGFGMPTTLLVDGSGSIVYRHTGAIEAAQLDDVLAEHLGVRP